MLKSFFFQKRPSKTYMSAIARSSSHQNLSAFEAQPPSMQRRHSFSSYENTTYKKPSRIDTESTVSRPALSKEERESLFNQAIFSLKKSDFMITHEFTEEAFKAAGLPPPKKQYPSVSLKTSRHPHFEWRLLPCKIIKTGAGNLVVTKEEATTIYSLDNEEKYYRDLENAESIIQKTNPHDIEIGLPWEKITRLGEKRFYLYETSNTHQGLREMVGFSHLTESHLGDCSSNICSSQAEVLKAAGDLIRQVSVLHSLNIYHMDIKPQNICKTKNGRFKLIDKYGSLDFTKKETMKRIFTKNFTATEYMIPLSLYTQICQSKKKDRAVALARSADIFALGSTIYQIAHIFTNKVHDLNSLPYLLQEDYWSKRNHPSTLKTTKKLDPTLRILSPSQQAIIKRSLSLNDQPTLKELQSEFPLYPPEKKGGRFSGRIGSWDDL